jgi:prepilin-type N-terminal cleavage/methylation domain-containing protein
MRHRIDKDRRGFTLVEMLIVVAIISVVTAVAVVAIAPLAEGMEMQELDTVAREIFAAAQNRATAMKASGELDAFTTAMGTGKTYFVFDPSVSDPATDYFAPQLTATARDGEYLVEIDTTTGQVKSVFFKDIKDGESPIINSTVATDLFAYKNEPDKRVEDAIGYYAANTTPTPPAGDLTPTIGVTTGDELYLTLKCPEIDAMDFESATAILTLSNGTATKVFTSEVDPNKLKQDSGSGATTFQVHFPLVKKNGEIAFEQDDPKLKIGDYVTAYFVVDYAGVSGKAIPVSFTLKLNPSTVTEVEEEEEGALPPVEDWTMNDYNKEEDKWTTGADTEHLYFVYFEQYEDYSFGYQLIDNSLTADKYPPLVNNKKILSTGYGIMAPKGAPLGDLLVIHTKEGGISEETNANKLYDTKFSDFFDGNKVYLYTFNTKRSRETSDEYEASPFDWAEGVVFKYKSNDGIYTGEEYYANFNFAPANSSLEIPGTERNPLVVRTMEQLQNAEYIKDDITRYVNITHDIDVEIEKPKLYQNVGRYLSSLWSNIILDGGGHTITGMKGMLFGTIEGTVMNLNISGAEIAVDYSYTSIFAVSNTGVVENCTVKDSIISLEIDWLQPGAFVGTNNGVMSNCDAVNVTLDDKRSSKGYELRNSFYYQRGSGTYTQCYMGVNLVS